MADSPVHYTHTNGVAVIQMDDGKANALSYSMLDALTAALDRAESEANAVILTGRPGRFCAGFDLKTMSASPESAVQLLTRGSEVMMRLYGFSLPVVVACSGHAIAGGVLLNNCGDVRIGIEGDFRLGLNEVAIKMPLPILAIEIARARLSPAALTEATLGARLFTSAEAVTAGYLDQIVPPDQLMDSAFAVAEAWGAYDRHAFHESKKRLRGMTIQYIEDTLEDDLQAFKSPAAE